MQRRLRYNFGTWRSNAQWRLPGKKCVSLQGKSDDVKLHDNQRIVIVTHIPVQSEELSDLSATSDTVFLPSKLQEIVIRRHQESGDIAVYLGDGEGV